MNTVMPDRMTLFIIELIRGAISLTYILTPEVRAQIHILESHMHHSGVLDYSGFFIDSCGDTDIVGIDRIHICLVSLNFFPICT